MLYLKQFLFFSILGYLFETMVGIITQNSFNSGILSGPYTPIYGFGIIIIIYGCDYLFKHFHLKRYQENIIVFGILFFTISILELIGGITIEKLFNKVFWSYESLPLNYGNYISIEVSLIWSFLGIIIYHFKNILVKIINKIPNIIFYILLVIFTIDVLYTIKDITIW